MHSLTVNRLAALSFLAATATSFSPNTAAAAAEPNTQFRSAVMQYISGGTLVKLTFTDYSRKTECADMIGRCETYELVTPIVRYSAYFKATVRKLGLNPYHEHDWDFMTAQGWSWQDDDNGPIVESDGQSIRYSAWREYAPTLDIFNSGTDVRIDYYYADGGSKYERRFDFNYVVIY